MKNNSQCQSCTSFAADASTPNLDGDYGCPSDRQIVSLEFGEFAIIASPHYPSNYINEECREWIIRSSPGTILDIEITDFKVRLF